MNNRVGFVVLYRWRLRAGKEQSFISAWSQVTLALKQIGSLGSRLHRGPDDIWYGYAQWPNEKSREEAFVSSSYREDANSVMRDAIEESLPEICLIPMVDYLFLPESNGD